MQANKIHTYLLQIYFNEMTETSLCGYQLISHKKASTTDETIL